MSTHASPAATEAPARGPKRLKPHQLVIGIGCAMGVFTLVSGITARGIPGGAGLEQFLLGHTAALTTADAVLLAAVAAAGRRPLPSEADDRLERRLNSRSVTMPNVSDE
jgi:hypothetical protein